MRTFIFGDVHSPYKDKKAFSAAVKACKASGADNIIIIGDFVDCYAVSAHPKSPERKKNLSWEIEEANADFDIICDIPADRHIYVGGNHEYRMDRYIRDRAPELFGLAGTTIPEMMQLKHRGVEWVPYTDYVKIGKVLYTHDLVRAGQDAVRQVANDAGTNVIFGHTHRGGTAYQGTVFDGPHVAMSVGWLGDVNSVDYKHKIKALRDWQHGYGLVDQDSKGYGWCQFIPIIDGESMLDGRVIKAP